MRILFIGLLLHTSLLAPRLVAAQGATVAAPIYVIDMQKVVNQSISGKAARNSIEEEMKTKRLKLEKLKLELDKMRDDIEKQKSLLSPEALESKQEQFLRKQRDFERVYQDQREELSRKNQVAIGKVVEQIDATVKSLAAKNNYAFVIEKDLQTVVYNSDEYDISDEVIKILDSKKMEM